MREMRATRAVLEGSTSRRSLVRAQYGPLAAPLAAERVPAGGSPESWDASAQRWLDDRKAAVFAPANRYVVLTTETPAPVALTRSAGFWPVMRYAAMFGVVLAFASLAFLGLVSGGTQLWFTLPKNPGWFD